MCYEDDINEDFGIEVEVEDEEADFKWKLASLNVDLALKFADLEEVKANSLLFQVDPKLYFANIAFVRKDIQTIHSKIGELAIAHYKNKGGV